MFIETLDELPKLTRSWLAPLEVDDRDLYGELAAALVIEPATAGAADGVLSGLHEILSAVDLRGKEIGAVEFAPAPGDTASVQIAEHVRIIRLSFDAGPNTVFIENYGQHSIFLSSNGVGPLDLSWPDARNKALSDSFKAFIIAQANAYAAFKMYIVEQSSAEKHWGIAAECALLPPLAMTDTKLIFELQLKH